MQCEQVRDHLSAYLDRELTAELAAAVRGHLASCPACRQELEALRATADLLGRLPVREPPADLPADVMGEIERRVLAPSDGAGSTMPERTLALHRARLWPRVLAVAACVALATGIGVLAYIGWQPRHPPAAPGPESGLALDTGGAAYVEKAGRKVAARPAEPASPAGDLPPADLAWGFATPERPRPSDGLLGYGDLLAEADKATPPDEPDLSLGLDPNAATARGAGAAPDRAEARGPLDEDWSAIATLPCKPGEGARPAKTEGRGPAEGLEVHGLAEAEDWTEETAPGLTLGDAVAAGETDEPLAVLRNGDALTTGLPPAAAKDAAPGDAETAGDEVAETARMGRGTRFGAVTIRKPAAGDAKTAEGHPATREGMAERDRTPSLAAGTTVAPAEAGGERGLGEVAEPPKAAPTEAEAKAGAVAAAKAAPAEGEAVAPQTTAESAEPVRVQMTMNRVALGQAPLKALRQVATPSNLDQATNQLNVRTTSRAAANRELVHAFAQNGWTNLDEAAREEDLLRKKARADRADARESRPPAGVYYRLRRNGEDTWVVLATVDDLSRFATQVAQSRTMQVEADSSQPFQAVRRLQTQLAAFETQQQRGAERRIAKSGGRGGAGAGEASRGRRAAAETEAPPAEMGMRVARVEKPAGPPAPEPSPKAGPAKARDAAPTGKEGAAAEGEASIERIAKAPAREAEPAARQVGAANAARAAQQKAPPAETAPAQPAMPADAAQPHFRYLGRVPPNQVMLIVRVRGSAEPPHAAIPEAGQTEAAPSKQAEERQTAPAEQE